MLLVDLYNQEVLKATESRQLIRACTNLRPLTHSLIAQELQLSNQAISHPRMMINIVQIDYVNRSIRQPKLPLNKNIKPIKNRSNTTLKAENLFTLLTTLTLSTIIATPRDRSSIAILTLCYKRSNLALYIKMNLLKMPYHQSLNKPSSFILALNHL